MRYSQGSVGSNSARTVKRPHRKGGTGQVLNNREGNGAQVSYMKKTASEAASA